MAEITLKVKDLFFDRKKVQNKVDRMKRRNLSRQGAFIRRRARSSLRRRKKVSQPGKPPSVHSKSTTVTLKFILFAYEPVSEGVVVGPVGLNGKRLQRSSAQTVPELMEKGGSLILDQILGQTGWRNVSERRALLTSKPKRTVHANYLARPFMGPALDKEIEAGNVNRVWKDSLKSG